MDYICQSLTIYMYINIRFIQCSIRQQYYVLKPKDISTRNCSMKGDKYINIATLPIQKGKCSFELLLVPIMGPKEHLDMKKQIVEQTQANHERNNTLIIQYHKHIKGLIFFLFLIDCFN